MIKKIAFLLLALILTTQACFATAPTVFPGGPYSGARNTNIDLNGYATSSGGSITSLSWTVPAGCTVVKEFVYPSGDQNRNDAIITCTNIVTGNTTLTAINELAETGTGNAQLTISNRAPTATLDVAPSTGNPELTVTFTGSCTDPDADLNTCRISFGDGNNNAFTNSMTYTYNNAGSYAVTLTATDLQGATGTDSEAITVSTPAAPTVNNKRPNTDVNMARPTVSFDVNDSGSGIDTTSLKLFINGTQVTPTVNKIENNYHVSWTFGEDKSDGTAVHVWLRVSDTLGNSTGDVNWNFTVDMTAPTFSGVDIAGYDNEPYTNDSTPSISLEGVSGSPAYVALTCDDDGTWKAWQSYSNPVTSFDITSSSYGCLGGDLDEVTIYVKLKDAAGNVSGIRNDSITFDDDVPPPPDLKTANPRNKGVYLEWSSVNDDGPSEIKEYIIYKDGSVYGASGCCSDTVTGLTGGSNYSFKVRARDKAGNMSGYSDEMSATASGSGSNDNVDADDTPPYLEWELPADNAAVSGIVVLKVQSYDDESGIRFVQFRVDDVSIETDYSASGERYSIDWNSETVVDGTHTIKAIAKNRSDTSDDTTVESITLKTNNGITEIVDRVVLEGSRADAESAIEGADNAKEAVALFFAGLGELGVSADADSLDDFASASSLLEEAQELFDDGNFEGAASKAQEAKKLLDALESNNSIEGFGEAQSYVYNSQQLSVLLAGIGLDQALVSEAQGLMDECGTSRLLEMKKVSDAGRVYYKAVFTLSVDNETDSAMDVKLVEVIPKSLVERASGIAGEGFSVLVDDPVLMWEESVGANSTVEVRYLLKAELSEQQANSLLGEKALDKFVVPPIVLNKGTAVNQQSFSSGITGTGLFGLSDALAALGWVVLIVAVIGVVLFAMNYYRGREEGTGLGFDGAMRRSGFSSGFFDRISGKKEEPKGPRWAYKG